MKTTITMILMVNPIPEEIRLKLNRPNHSLNEKPGVVFLTIRFFQGLKRVLMSWVTEK